MKDGVLHMVKLIALLFIMGFVGSAAGRHSAVQPKHQSAFARLGNIMNFPRFNKLQVLAC